MQDSSPNNKNDVYNDFIDIKKFFFIILSNLNIFFFSILVSIIAWLIFYNYTPKIYSVESMIQIERPNSSINGTDSIESILLGGENTLLSEQIAIYKSHSNVKSLVKELKMNLLINELPLYENKQFSEAINKIDFKMPLDQESIVIFIIPQENTYDINNSKNEPILLKAEWGKDYQILNGIINLNRINIFEDKIKFEYFNENKAIQNLQDSIKIQQVDSSRNITSNNTLLKIIFEHSNTDFGEELVNNLNKIFQLNSINNNKFEASQSLEFLNLQLDIISKQLKDKEFKLNDLRKQNSSLDLESEIKSLIEASALVDKAIKDIDFEVVKARSLYENSNPIFVTLLNQRELLLAEKSEIDNRIKSLPENQQKFVDLSRDLQADQLIIEELLKKQLEYSLVQASTLGDVKVIDPAYTKELVFPKFLSSLLGFIAFFILIAAMIIFARHNFLRKLTSPEEVSEIISDIVSLGVIPNANDNNNHYKNSISSLASSLLLIAKNKSKKIFSFISGAPGQGKSFLTDDIASELAGRKQNVLVIDADYRKGVHNREKANEHRKVINFFEDFFGYEKFKVSENLTVIPAPYSRKTRSITIFESVNFLQFLEKARNDFDIILIDTPAFLAMPDTFVLAQLSDENIVVVKHDSSTVSSLKELSASLNSANIETNYSIYNAFKINTFLNYYGYYGYYGYTQYDYESYSNYYEQNDDE